jgi:protein-S-isoprenylcysteine O-methyltransferase Ste14
MAAAVGGSQRRGLVIAVGVVGAVVNIGLSALGWGGFARLVAHPARAAYVALVVALTAVALLSPVNFSSGEREDVENRRMLVPSAVGTLVLAWVMPYMDRRDAWTIDGDATRWLGIAVLAVGGVLRIWPMFVLGRRFSGLVAIQPGHELATEGPYRWVRHPSYLGAMLALFGSALVFRSGVGVVAAVLGFPLLFDRIDAEERLLATRFGAAYDEYRRRTWRLIPGIY